MSETSWNGESAQAMRAKVLVPKWSEGDAPLAWWREFGGTIRHAVVVRYNGQKHVLDNEDGSGWRKVTEGRGSPRIGHRSLPSRCAVLSGDSDWDGRVSGEG